MNEISQVLRAEN